MSTITSTSPLTTEELNSLASLIPYATEQELESIEELLTGEKSKPPKEPLPTPDQWQAAIDENLRKYCPHSPWPKQKLFLDLKCREILFGGAKGPGKTDALLMAALRYIHVPGYSCLILRVSTKEAKQANSIMDRLQRWTANTDVRWNLIDSVCRFPSGAMIKFGYVSNMQDAYQFQSSEYQTIIWDELTDFLLGDNAEKNPYLFMFGMNRKPEIGCHPLLELVPLQCLAGTNPGGRSHRFVKGRFITDEALEAIRDPTPRAFFADEGKTRAYIPALITDNPAIDAEKYVRESLSHLGPITRARFVSGDWSVQEAGIFKLEWFRHWEALGGGPTYVYRLFNPDGSVKATFADAECRRFAVIDCAASSEEKSREKRGKSGSYSVISIFDYHRIHNALIWRFVDRGKWEFPELMQRAKTAHARWRPDSLLTEDEKTGRALIQTLAPFLPMSPRSHEGKDKLTRSSTLQNMAHDGKVFIPKQGVSEWSDELISELLSWQGLDDEQADQIDTGSYAAMEVNNSAAAAPPIRIESLFLSMN